MGTIITNQLIKTKSNMTTREDIKKLRAFLNTAKSIKMGMKMPKNIEAIIDGMCAEYETKYDLWKVILRKAALNSDNWNVRGG